MTVDYIDPNTGNLVGGGGGGDIKVESSGDADYANLKGMH